MVLENADGFIDFTVPATSVGFWARLRPNASTGSLTMTALDPAGQVIGTDTISATGPFQEITYTGVIDRINFVNTTDQMIAIDDFTAEVTANTSNAQPTFTASDPANVLEDSAPVSMEPFATFDPGSPTESTQAVVAYAVTDVSNPTLFTQQPSIDTSGNLSYAVAPNAFGSSTFTVTVQDDGGTADGGIDTSAPQTFTITVDGVNDSPSFSVATPEVSLFEDAGPQTVADFVSNFDAGPNEGALSTGSQVIHDEGTGGTVNPLSQDNMSPTNLGSLDVGINTVRGLTEAALSTGNVDVFTFTIDPGQQLDGLFVAEYDYLTPPAANERAAFLAISSGNTFPFNAQQLADPTLDETQFLGGSVFGLDDLPSAGGGNFLGRAGVVAGSGFTPPLGEGTYTFYIQQTGPANTYALDIQVSSVNASGQTAIAYPVTSISNPALFETAPSIDLNGNLTFTPAADAVGTSTFEVAVQDDGGTDNGGTDTSTTTLATITISGVNDAPSFVADNPPSVVEGSGTHNVAFIQSFTPGPDDESTQVPLGYTVSGISNPGLFSSSPAVSSNGALSYGLLDGEFGESEIVVTVQDSGGTANGGEDTSAPQTFTISVTGINDPPSFELSGEVSVNEDSSDQSVPGFAFNFDAGDGDFGQSVMAYTISNLSDPSLFATAPSIDTDGTLTFAPSADVSGSVTFDVVVMDTGGTAGGGVDQSPPVQGTITINPVNDAPSFFAMNPPTTLAGSEEQTINGFASNFNAGPADEAAQTLVAYSLTNVSNPELFSQTPTIDSSGNLRYTPASAVVGTSTFDLSVQDSGGTDNGGTNISDIQTFTITIAEALVLTWSDPADIVVGTALASDQLNATANVPGTFQYTPNIGTVLLRGNDQVLSAVFTADDPVYSPTTVTTSINVVDPPSIDDFGDAPSRYPVFLADDGARHRVGDLTLGTLIDTELDGRPTSSAIGDGNDDDGVRFITDLLGVESSVSAASALVTSSADARLDAWIDFNGDSDWNDDGEQIATSLPVVAGENVVTYTIPSGAVPGSHGARFRLSTTGGLGPTGLAVDGEVEDYLVRILDGASDPAVDVEVVGAESEIAVDSGVVVVRAMSSGIFRGNDANTGVLRVTTNDVDSVVTVDVTGGVPSDGMDLVGGSGANTLRVAGGPETLDLSETSNVSIQNFPAIDLSPSGTSTVRIDVGAVRALTANGGTLAAIRGAADFIEFADIEDWRLGASANNDGQFTIDVTHTNGEIVRTQSTHPWQHLLRVSDVNNSGDISTGDALRIINELGRREFSDRDSGLLMDPGDLVEWPEVYFDQNGDGLASSLDALRVINELSRIDLENNSPDAEFIDQAFQTAIEDDDHVCGPVNLAAGLAAGSSALKLASFERSADFVGPVNMEVLASESENPQASESTVDAAIELMF